MEQRKKMFDSYVTKSSSVIEVGPGAGSFCLWAEENGHSVTAMEYSDALAEGLAMRAGTELTVVAGDFDHNIFADGVYDVFCSFHVIEHVASPSQHLKQAARVTRRGGLAMMATPNARSWQQRLFPKLSLILIRHTSAYFLVSR